MKCLRFSKLLLVAAVFSLPWNTQAQTKSILEMGKFSAAEAGSTLPAGWNPLTFRNIERHTEYTLVKDGDTVVVKAVAQASASGLIQEMKIDPQEYPLVEWRWKVSNILMKGDVHRKEGDDYPARLYITFAYDPKKLSFGERAKVALARALYGLDPPLAAISYIWESRAPQGTMIANPYTNRAMMVVVESGAEKLQQWVAEERNVYEDFKRAFGEEPPMISGVAIMTDTDNTGESAIAFYGDISFKKKGGGVKRPGK